MGSLPDTWLAIDSAYGHAGVVPSCKGRREGILVDGLRYIRYVYVNENDGNIYIARQFWFTRIGRPLRIPKQDIEIIHSPYMGLFPYEMKLKKIKGLELRISSGLAHVLSAEAGANKAL